MSSWGNVSLAIIHCQRSNGDLNTEIGNGDEMKLGLGETTNKTAILIFICNLKLGKYTEVRLVSTRSYPASKMTLKIGFFLGKVQRQKKSTLYAILLMSAGD